MQTQILYTGELLIKVCQADVSLPVDVPWHFRANDFLIESLQAHSVLSLVCLLTALRERALMSFMFVGPTWLRWSPSSLEGADLPEGELDLLAVIDGKTVICEVKSSWASLRASDIG